MRLDMFVQIKPVMGESVGLTSAPFGAGTRSRLVATGNVSVGFDRGQCRRNVKTNARRDWNDSEKGTKVNIRESLESMPLFSELSGPEIELMVPLCRVLEGRIGQYILEEGAPVHTIFFMVAGEANVRKEGQLLATVGKGAVLGEMSLLQHGPAFATIQAKGPFKAIAIDQLAFNRLLEDHARLGYKILKKIARLLTLRLMMTDAKLAECMSIPHDYRHEGHTPACPLPSQ